MFPPLRSSSCVASKHQIVYRHVDRAPQRQSRGVQWLGMMGETHKNNRKCARERLNRNFGVHELQSKEADFPGVYYAAPAAADTEGGSSSSGTAGATAGGLRSGLLCPNPECQALYWGAPNAASCFARLFNRVTLTVRQHVKKYYDCWLLCDDSGCNRRTRQQSVLATACLARGCHGHMGMEYSEKQLHTQLKFLETLLDVKRAKAKKIGAGVVPVPLPDGHVRMLDLLHDQTKQVVSSTAYDWIRPSLWSMVFGGVKQQGQQGPGAAAGGVGVGH